jgi:hypothetical protein
MTAPEGASQGTYWKWVFSSNTGNILEMGLLIKYREHTGNGSSHPQRSKDPHEFSKEFHEVHHEQLPLRCLPPVFTRHSGTLQQEFKPLKSN